MPSTPPNVLNYYIGRGNVFTAAVDSTSWVHVGNCPRFSVTPHQSVKSHFSSMAAGSRVQDDSVLDTRSMDVHIDADEMHAETLALALGATLVSGVYRVGVSTVERAVKFVGNNDHGPKVQIILPRVQFTFDNEVDFISDDYSKFPLVGVSLYYPKTAAGSDYTFLDLTFL